MQCDGMGWDRMDLDGMGWDGAVYIITTAVCQWGAPFLVTHLRLSALLLGGLLDCFMYMYSMSIQFKPFICSCHELGILIAPDKTVHVGPSGTLTFGGIQLDSFKYEALLPPEKNRTMC